MRAHSWRSAKDGGALSREVAFLTLLEGLGRKLRPVFEGDVEAAVGGTHLWGGFFYLRQGAGHKNFWSRPDKVAGDP